MSFWIGLAIGIPVGLAAGYLALVYHFHKGSWGG